MNPYDFARIDWSKAPQRHRPIWHHRFVSDQAEKLYSGFMEIDIQTETQFFMINPRFQGSPMRSMQNKSGAYIIPGSSLKGMIRGLVETLGNGCLTLFDGNYESEKDNQGRRQYRASYKTKIARGFEHCDNNTHLCIACRTFGMLKERVSGVFLGKINIGDAWTLKETREVELAKPMYTLPLVTPKPHHEAFYLDPQKRYISGRKFYFHHSAARPPLAENGPRKFPGNSIPVNKYIHPLAAGNTFRFRLDFTNLEKDEFAVLLLAVLLENGMRHKLGYGKPLGLGTVHLEPVKLTLIDYTARYTQLATNKGMSEYTGPQIEALKNQLLAEVDKKGLLNKLALEDLRRIWRWPVDPAIEYYYPSKTKWFDTSESTGKRIAETRDVPRDNVQIIK